MTHCSIRHMEVKLYTDGGARGNPGPGAAGVHIITRDQEYTYGFCLGEVTNNQAEYLALKLGLEVLPRVVAAADIECLHVYLDSELIVKQLKKEYKVKDPVLKKLNQAVQVLIKPYPVIEFNHVLRAKNVSADQAVNQVLDLQNGIKRFTQTPAA